MYFGRLVISHVFYRSQHVLECKKVGLVIFRHNEIQDELVNLASRALTPSVVHDEPLIHGHANENVKTSPTKVITNHNIDEEATTGEDERGNLLIRGFWTAGTDCILDVRVTDTDAKSYCKRTCPKC